MLIQQPEADKPPWERRHVEWKVHVQRWKFLLDSWEGGEATARRSTGST
jgi:hypothetical protein